ncbi:MAG: hypothetical protein OER74_03040 [Desulfobacteraceae bacterium]|nr:hypothetical protein [Desulfobacteraceae bacterium]
MAEHRNRGRIDASRERIDRHAVPNNLLDFFNLPIDEVFCVKLLRDNLFDHLNVPFSFK